MESDVKLTECFERGFAGAVTRGVGGGGGGGGL